MPSSFKTIRARAARRKGGEAALARLLPKVATPKQLAKVPDDRILSEMSKRIFCSGFVWTVIDKKWPGFEEAFLGFVPQRLVFEPDEFWSDRAGDTRIVRNAQKIMAVRQNARFVTDIAAEHGSFARFLSTWPLDDEIGLLALLGKRGSRLGGNTGQYFLRFIGRDGFVLSRDVIACLRDAGVDIAETPSSKKDMAAIQAQFNAWAAESGLPYTHLSRICAMSMGENYTAEQLDQMSGE